MHLPRTSAVVLQSAVSAGGLLLVVLAAHWPAIQAGTVWDDNRYVFDNTILHEPGGIGRIWFDFGASPDYYPLTFTTWWLEYRLTNLNVEISHGVNVLLHALSAIVLWRVLRPLMTVGVWLTAALFAVHPVTVESVAWLAERKNTLSMLLFLGSMLMVLRFEDANHEEAASNVGRQNSGHSRMRASHGDVRRLFAPATYIGALFLFTMTLSQVGSGTDAGRDAAAGLVAPWPDHAYRRDAHGSLLSCGRSPRPAHRRSRGPNRDQHGGTEAGGRLVALGVDGLVRLVLPLQGGAAAATLDGLSPGGCQSGFPGVVVAAAGAADGGHRGVDPAQDRGSSGPGRPRRLHGDAAAYIRCR